MYLYIVLLIFGFIINYKILIHLRSYRYIQPHHQPYDPPLTFYSVVSISACHPVLDNAQEAGVRFPVEEYLPFCLSMPFCCGGERVEGSKAEI
jgi:hypothetical protein